MINHLTGGHVTTVRKHMRPDQAALCRPRAASPGPPTRLAACPRCLAPGCLPAARLLRCHLIARCCSAAHPARPPPRHQPHSAPAARLRLLRPTCLACLAGESLLRIPPNTMAGTDTSSAHHRCQFTARRISGGGNRPSCSAANSPVSPASCACRARSNPIPHMNAISSRIGS